MILSGRNLKVDEVDLGVVNHKTDTGKAMAKARVVAIRRYLKTFKLG